MRRARGKEGHIVAAARTGRKWKKNWVVSPICKIIINFKKEKWLTRLSPPWLRRWRPPHRATPTATMSVCRYLALIQFFVYVGRLFALYPLETIFLFCRLFCFLLLVKSTFFTGRQGITQPIWWTVGMSCVGCALSHHRAPLFKRVENNSANLTRPVRLIFIHILVMVADTSTSGCICGTVWTHATAPG